MEHPKKTGIVIQFREESVVSSPHPLADARPPSEGVAKGREVDLAIGSQQSANSPEGAT